MANNLTDRPEKRGQAHLRGESRLEVGAEVFYGWDDDARVILSIVLTGVAPLATATGISVGLAASQVLPWLWALFAGVGCFVAMPLLQVGLLWTLTRNCVRQRFIPWARGWLPPSGEVAKRSRS
jgi:hypothetical protein